jgi:MFS family permease
VRRSKRPRTSALPATVVLLGFTSLFTDIGTEMIFPLLPVFLVDSLGASPAYMGLVEGAATTVASVLKLASGVLSDTVRRKPLVLFGYGLASAVRPFIALATRPWHVLAVRVTDRIGKGVRGSPRDALIADAAGDRAGRAFGFHQAMDNTGAVIGPLLATVLLGAKLSLRQVFWFAAVPGAVATALVAFVREPARDAPGVRAPSSPEEPASLDRSLWIYFAILTVFSLANSSDAFLLLRAHAAGVSTASIPVLWAALNLSKVAWAYLGGSWADRVSRPGLIATGWLVYAVVYLGLGLADAAWQVWILFVAYGVFYGLTEPVEKALVKDLSSPAVRGRAYGVYNFVVGITALPASLLTGALWRAWSPTGALVLSAALSVAAGAALMGWDIQRRRAAA